MGKERTEIEKILGIPAGTADVYVKCGLAEPPHPRFKPVYLLFLAAGRPCDDNRATSYSVYAPTVSSRGGGFAFCYSSDDNNNNIPWEVPMWAIRVAMQIISTVQSAESVGREVGYESGLSHGKSFVKRLANARTDGSRQEVKIDICHLYATAEEKRIYTVLKEKGKLQDVVLSLSKERN